MVKKIFLTCIAIFALAVLSATAADMTQTGQAMGAFLKISPDAHFVAMGNVGTASSSGVSALHYNPAGIVGAETEAMFTHSMWFADITFDYLAIQIPVSEKSRLAFSFMHMSYPQMEETTVMQPDGTGIMFDAGDTAIGVSYGVNLLREIDFGFTVKIIQMTIWDMEANGFAVDAGIKYRTPIKGLTAGMSIANFGSNSQFSGGQLERMLTSQQVGNAFSYAQVTETFALPGLLRVGLAYEPFVTRQYSTLICADFVNSIDNNETFNIGGEFMYNVNAAFGAAVRAGYHADGTLNDSLFSFGGGVNYDFGGFGVTVDYAYNGYEQLDATHLFTLKLKF